MRLFFKLCCPVCGKGKLFHGYLDTPERCPECGYYFMRETGYFLPHAPISYLGIVTAAFLTWAALRYILHVQSDFIVLGTTLVAAFLFAVWSNRYTKMLWLLFDLWLHPPTREDFEDRGRQL